jgi:hypothetical protein
MSLHQIAEYVTSHGNVSIVKKDHVVIGSKLWNVETREMSWEWTKVRTVSEARDVLGY